MAPSRRQFIGTSAAAAAAAASLGLPEMATAMASREPKAESRELPSAGVPVVVASANGFRSKHADGRPAVQVAYDSISKGDDPLDAIVSGIEIVELDATDFSVGLQGFPNEEGVVQLDASVMHGPTRRAGAVAALEDIATPAAVAKLVMERTDHLLLAGAGAKRFAIGMGFKEQPPMRGGAHQAWLRWRSLRNPNDAWLDTPPPGARRPDDDPMLHIWYDEFGVPHTSGTVHMNAVTARGDIASATSTSGMSWKIPGRVGDSPIVGAGQYCDNLVGAAGSTGRGEANIKVCGAFLAVEFMRQGMTPEQAIMKTMERVVAMTEDRLLDSNKRPYFQLQFYAVNKKGEFAGATAYEGTGDGIPYAVCDSRGPRLEKCAYLWKGDPPVKRTPDAQLSRP